jgi:chorismate mutase-like protein
MANTPNPVRLEALRAQLDEIDQRLLHVVRDRLSICVQIAAYKREHDVPMMQPDRITLVQDRAAAFASEHGISAEFLRRLYDALIQEACRLEDEVMGERRA